MNGNVRTALIVRLENALEGKNYDQGGYDTKTLNVLYIKVAQKRGETAKEDRTRKFLVDNLKRIFDKQLKKED